MENPTGTQTNPPPKNWEDGTIWTGDNLHIMRGMNSATVDLIYMDPPFNSDADYSAPTGSPAEGSEFKDTWSLADMDEAWLRQIEDGLKPLWYLLMGVNGGHSSSMLSYLVYMIPRLVEAKRILKPAGSVYLHCDQTASHYLKTVMDCIFGQENFRREIVWKTPRPSGFKTQAQNWIRGHDIILYYTMGKQAVFNKQYEPYEDDYIANFNRQDEHGKYWLRDGKKRYLKEGYNLSDTWTDIPSMQTQSVSRAEGVGYPTQKPLALLERIIKASSNPGDIVFDPFCGCATTCVAARRLNRKWVGIDISEKAADLVEKRIADDEPLFGAGGIRDSCVRRDDIPERTDLGDIQNLEDAEKGIYDSQAGNCYDCGNHFTATDLKLGHIIPRNEGGSDHPSNLQLLCEDCTRSKENRSQERLIGKLEELGLKTAVRSQ